MLVYDIHGGDKSGEAKASTEPMASSSAMKGPIQVTFTQSVQGKTTKEDYFHVLWMQRLKPQVDIMLDATVEEKGGHRVLSQRCYQDTVRLCQLGKSKELIECLSKSLEEMVSREIGLLSEKISQQKNKEDAMQIDSGDAVAGDQEQFVDVLVSFWIDFCKRMQAVRDVFIYLERTHLTQQRGGDLEGRQSFWQIGLGYLQASMASLDLKDMLVKGILNLIDQDRVAASDKNKSTIQKLAHILLALKLYQGDFEEKLFQRTSQFYTAQLNEASNPINSNLSQYLIKVQNILKDESVLVRECLDVSTHDRLLGIIQDLLVAEQSQRLLNHADFELFMKESRIEDLKRLNSLFNKVSGSSGAQDATGSGLQMQLRVRWKKYVQAEGERMLNDEDLAKKGFRAIEDFIAFKEKSVTLVRQVFPLQSSSGALSFETNTSAKGPGNAKTQPEHFQFGNIRVPNQNASTQIVFLKYSVQDAFNDFLNIEPNIVAEFLAKFLDFHLKKTSGQAGISDESLINVIDEVLILFRIVKAKDIFEEFYQRGLCRRLLLKKSASYDSEKMMIMKLKTECGDHFIQKVERMLKDLTASDQFMREYLKVKGDSLAEKYSGAEVNFHVLSSNSWPIQQNVKSNLPHLIGRIQDDFDTYYKNRNQGKCIKYCIQMCTALVEAKFKPKNVKLLDLSGTQALVLLAFNDAKRLMIQAAEQDGKDATAVSEGSDRILSFEQLASATGLDDDELKKQLISLSMLEHQVLQVVDNEQPAQVTESSAPDKPAVMSKRKTIRKAITKTDKFKVNFDFRSKLKRIQVNSIQKKETRQESDAVHDKVLADRKLYVDAAIVKTMKGRKTLKHNDLLAEVIRMTRFPCEVETIVARIKVLIEMEYMRYDDSDNKLYHYVA